jgi:peptidoglycan/LPS O-acetylase OafA/YrhL
MHGRTPADTGTLPALSPGETVREHIAALDGLRGVAAFSVFVFHVVELIVPGAAQNPFRHAYLAVDFFFGLSGYIRGHAYDPANLPFPRFIGKRLRRLHPLAVMGATLGLLAYVFDPFATADQVSTIHDMPWLLLLNVVLALALLPAPALPGSWNMTHSLNGPSWSLFQEYVANIVYATIGRRVPRPWLAGFAAASASALLPVALSDGNLTGGWSWDNAGVGAARVSASFSTGLLIYRLRLAIRLPLAFPILSAVLLLVFTAPDFGQWSGWFDWLVAMVVFPLVIMAGAARTSARRGILDRIADLGGRLSYPLYILHYPFLTWFAHWIWQAHPDAETTWSVAAAILAGIPPLSWLILVHVDEPLRRKLARGSDRSSLDVGERA